MTEHDFFAGEDAAFEGELSLAWRGLPAGALVKRVTVTLTPLAAPGRAPFEEAIDFGDPADGARTLGATRIAGAGFVEVDFHARRTLAAVRGGAGAGLQVDLGGLYVEINDRGAIVTPTRPTPLAVPADGTLPGLTASKIKLTAGTTPVSGVLVRSVPANVSLRLGKLGPFWTRPGELALAATSPDFAALLQTFLISAPVENGHYVVPLIVHSDTLARLRLDLEVDYLESVAATPAGLNEVLLPYDFASLPKTPGVLAVALPPDARVIAGDTTARVTGKFEQTRVVAGYGPTGAVVPVGAAAVAPATSQAQAVGFDRPVAASAIDLLLTPVSRSAKLALDLRADLDGKPDGRSLLGGAVGFTLDGSAAHGPAWTSVALGKEFHFQPPSQPPAKPAGGRYWIVLQSAEGEVQWNAVNGSAALPALQYSSDGGLSWRAAPLATQTAAANPPLAALYRLRYVPARYGVPIELQVGSDEHATRVKLDRFEALGRVDFRLDVPEVAAGFNRYLDGVRAAGCSSAELLANGDFGQWLTLGTDLRAATSPPLSGTAAGSIVISPDGQLAYAGTSVAGSTLTSNSLASQLAVLDTLRDAPAGPAIGPSAAAAPRVAAISPDGRRIYVCAPGANADTSLQVVDAATRTVLGAVSSLPGVPVAAAVSPDGARLYLATVADGVVAYDAAALETAARAGTPLPASALTRNAALAAAALAVAPDGGRLFAAAGTSLLGLDPLTLQQRSAVVLGDALAGLALRPDGRRAVVAGTAAGTGRLWIVDPSSGRTIAVLGLGAGQPVALALAPDGARAYVAVTIAAPAGTALLSVDLALQRVVGSLPLTVPPGPDVWALAATPLGNRLYLAYGSASGQIAGLVSIAVGAPVPADWTAHGRTALAPADTAPAHVLELSGAGADDAASISQIVPVTGGCAYLLRFDATASAGKNFRNPSFDAGRGPLTAPDAVAELIWLGSDCGLARADREPIGVAPGGALAPHRVRAVAPPGARQVELRFLARAGTVVRVAGVSLAGSGELVGNGDLRQTGSDGLPSGWALAVPALRAGLTVRPGGAGAVRLANAGTQAVDLVQRVDVSAGAPLRLAFDGRASGAAAASVDLHFLAADASPAAEPVRVAVGRTDLARHRAALTVPAAASGAELHLVVPPATSLEIGSLSLRSAPSAAVPLTFVAQSPGELRVADARVAYERVAPVAPPLPAAGLCRPTPPDRPAGDPGPADGGYCGCCEAQRATTRPVAAQTPSGRPATVAACATCGTPVLRTGGPPAAAGVAAVPPPTIALRPLPTAAPVAVSAVAAPLALTDLPNIGVRRARALTDAGITTVAALAAAAPDVVAAAMRGMGPVDPNLLIAGARARLVPPA